MGGGGGFTNSFVKRKLVKNIYITIAVNMKPYAMVYPFLTSGHTVDMKKASI